MNRFLKTNHTISRKEDCMETLEKTCLVFTIIGAINWGLVGLFDFNLVNFLFGSIGLIESAIYILVGVCGLINIGLYIMHFEEHK